MIVRQVDGRARRNTGVDRRGTILIDNDDLRAHGSEQRIIFECRATYDRFSTEVCNARRGEPRRLRNRWRLQAWMSCGRRLWKVRRVILAWIPAAF